MERTSFSYSLDELCSLAQLPKRTIRYYIQLGLVDRPDGETRGARYAPRHLEQISRVRNWQRTGMTLDRIREHLAAGHSDPIPRKRIPGSVEVWSHLVVAEGVELHVDPKLAQLKPEHVRELFKQVSSLLETIRNQGGPSGHLCPPSGPQSREPDTEQA